MDDERSTRDRMRDLGVVRYQQSGDAWNTLGGHRRYWCRLDDGRTVRFAVPLEEMARLGPPEALLRVLRTALAAPVPAAWNVCG